MKSESKIIFIQDNAFENGRILASILSWPQFINGIKPTHVFRITFEAAGYNL